MPKYTVWECDKCSSQVIGNGLPSGWKIIQVFDSENEAKSLGRGTEHLWCGGCYADIKQPMPQPMQVQVSASQRGTWVQTVLKGSK